MDLVWNAIISSAAQKESVFEEIEGVEEESTITIITDTEHVVSIDNSDDDIAAAVVATVLTPEVDIVVRNNLVGQEPNTTTTTAVIMST